VSHKLFILVDRTLSRSQQAVQACHAAIEFSKKYPNWEHQSLVLLGIDSPDELDEWYFQIAMRSEELHLQYAPFFESHWDHRLTALACHGCDDLVKDLRLL
jgi:hypothetical protein